MTATEQERRTSARRRSAIARGAIMGGLVGLSLSAIYAALALVVWAIYLLATNLEGDRLGATVIGTGILSVCGWVFAFGVGVVPGTLLGALIGLVAGLALATRKRTSPAAGACIGTLVGAIAVAAVNAGVSRAMLTDSRSIGLYWLWIGIPSILTLAGSAFIGWRLAKTIQLSETL
jgi:hypothetical protein